MKTLYVELANTPIKRHHGLMDRKSLHVNGGMLFKFPQDDYLGFWMSNTYIPLDIAFVADDGKILQIEAMSPLSTRSIRSKNLCRYALEVNRGWFDNNNIEVGAYIGGLGLKRQAQVQELESPTDMGIGMDESNQQPNANIPPVDGEITDGQPQEVNPDIMINMSFRQMLEDADIKNKKLIVVYQTKKGIMLPPKIISPPFTFEDDENGKSNSVVKIWDEQSGGWKSFLIDNIIDMEPFNENE